MAQRIGTTDAASSYSQSGRFAALFANSLQRPVAPSLVAEKILQVTDSGTWQLRHLVGPDSVPLTEMRKRMTEEEWIEMNAADDATFFARLTEEISK